MIRRIIQIDEEKCNGCGACAEACHEGAIGMVNGKATLLRDDYCDGLGDCLPTCPTGAISFVEREAAAYDEKLCRKYEEKAKAIMPLFPYRLPRQSNAAYSTFTRNNSFCPGTDRITVGTMAMPNQTGTD